MLNFCLQRSHVYFHKYETNNAIRNKWRHHSESPINEWFMSHHLFFSGGTLTVVSEPWDTGN